MWTYFLISETYVYDSDPLEMKETRAEAMACYFLYQHFHLHHKLQQKTRKLLMKVQVRESG